MWQIKRHKPSPTLPWMVGKHNFLMVALLAFGFTKLVIYPMFIQMLFHSYFCPMFVPFFSFYSLFIPFFPVLIHSYSIRIAYTDMGSAKIIERKLKSTKVRLSTVPSCSIIIDSSDKENKKLNLLHLTPNCFVLLYSVKSMLNPHGWHVMKFTLYAPHASNSHLHPGPTHRRGPIDLGDRTTQV